MFWVCMRALNLSIMSHPAILKALLAEGVILLWNL